MTNKNEKRSQGKLGKKIWIAAVVVLLAAVAIAVRLTGGKAEPENELCKINTPYIDLRLPQEMEAFITTDESTYGDVYTRGFYMNYGGDEYPLWRLDFGDPYAGDWVGVLKTDKGDVAVTTTGFAISAEELAALGEEGSALYGECMQAYGVMLEGIVSDSRFTEERPLAVGEDREVKLTYWTVMLPDTMTVSENTESGSYEAMFYGKIAGETVKLYRVCIGEEQAESFLGYFEVGGMKQTVTVGSYELAGYDDWADDDYAAAYSMMDTINDVIQQIMSSEQFSEN